VKLIRARRPKSNQQIVFRGGDDSNDQIPSLEHAGLAFMNKSDDEKDLQENQLDAPVINTSHRAHRNQ
jgi:hypothetical protein